MLSYVKSIENFNNILPIDRKLVKVGEKIVSVIIFHYTSVSALGAIIYLLIQSDTGDKHLR